MNKLIITRLDCGIMTALQSDGEIVQLNLEPISQASVLGNIYIGKVKNIVKNINSAFVEFQEGQMGYYSLSDNKTHHYASPHSGNELKAGDEIIVQVAKDAVKTKAPVLTGNLSFPGKYCVLTLGKRVLGFSSKITSQEWKTQLKERLSQSYGKDEGIIVRTNAQGLDGSVLEEELERLKAVSGRVLSDALYRTCYTCLYRAVPSYLSDLRDQNSGLLQEIITDDAELFQELTEYLTDFQPDDLEKLKFYNDNLLPLKKLYSLETSLEHALSRKVWLKSGGYLVVDPTEALVVIDVNTGKYSGKKNLRDTIRKTNMEAAAEIVKLLRLRNLSGIIIIDFIDMELEEDRKELLSFLTQQAAKDPIKTTVVDITKLNLVEMTRKKVRRPLHEQAAFTKGE